ncbi:T9SS-regulating ECF sigma factor SigP [Porphyromonas loveana]|uniref:T9SS-regulating ECF sigma factor SigP n=1 Tax=Porphyromonas loveana TaxID=1884669 RepID=UPI0035A11507
MSNFHKLTDDELVGLYTEGCDEAFDVILSRYDAVVHTYIRFSVSDADVAEDIFQDTFIKVIHTLRRGQYVPAGKFKAWLLRLAHNLVMDHYRRIKGEGARLQSFDDEDAAPVERVPDTRLTAEEELIEQATIDELEQYLGLLPEVQQEVVRMRYWEDMSFREIAEATGVSINTALGRMRYALINLRKMMGSLA